MAYTRRKLNQARKVQNIVKRYGRHGSGNESGHSNEWIYANMVFPQFDISKVTFYNYLSIDVRYELKQIENKLNFKQ
jgi:hypothetical protein